MHAPLLLADIADILRALIPIIMIVFWVLAQVLGGREEAPPKKQPKKVAPRPKGAKPDDNLREEIEVFLRKSDENRREEPRPREPVRADRSERRSPPERPAPRERRAPATARQPRTPRVPEPPPIEAEIVTELDQPRESLAEHVKRYIDAKAFQSRLGGLGQAIELSDERTEARLHEKFDHGLGSLGGAGVYERIHEGTDAAHWADHVDPTSPAVQIAAMLQDPKNARSAIVLTEILNRPNREF